MVVTIKKADGYVYKRTFGISLSGTSRTMRGGPGRFDLTSGEKYWFDLSVRNVGLSDKLSIPR